MFETLRALPFAKRVFDVIEKGGWRRVSGAFCVGIISIFILVGSADAAHVWLNGQSMSMDKLHIGYLWELTKMFLLVYGAKHLLPHGIRLIALKMFKGDPASILLLFGEPNQEETPKAPKPKVPVITP